MNNQCIMLENNLQDKSNQNKAQTSFTIEQIPQLLRVLQNFKNKINQINATSDSSLPQNKIKKINSWILGTGATDHVTHEKYFC